MVFASSKSSVETEKVKPEGILKLQRRESTRHKRLKIQFVCILGIRPEL